MNKSYDHVSGVYYLLLERWTKAYNKKGAFQSIVAPSSPSLAARDEFFPGGEEDVASLLTNNEVIVVEDMSRPGSKSPDGQIPVVHVTPDSPTVPFRTPDRQDEMPKFYLERRHPIPSPCGMPDGVHEMRMDMPMHMPLALQPPGPYAPGVDHAILYKEQCLPAPTSFQVHTTFNRRASDGAASLAAGIAQFHAMHERNMPESGGENLLGSATVPFSSSPPSPYMGDDYDSGSDQEPDPEDVAKYLRLRGNKRHTLAGASEIPPEIQTRLCQFPKFKGRFRTPSRERMCANREGNYVGVSGMARYNARRSSDGAASLLAFTQHLEKKAKKGSLKEIHAEHLRLQQRFLNNGQHDALKLQQQHHFHQHHQHQQHPSPAAQQRPQLNVLGRLKDHRGRRFSDGPENLAATLAEFNNQLSLSQQKKQLQSIESQHPLNLPKNVPVSPGSSLPTSDYPMDEEMQERAEIFPGPDHVNVDLPKEPVDSVHSEDAIQHVPISSPSRPEVYSPANSSGELLNILHLAPSGGQPQEQLQKEMQRLQLEPIGCHLPGTNGLYCALSNNVLLTGQNQNPGVFQGPSSPESYSAPFPNQQRSPGDESYFQPESPSMEKRTSARYNNNAIQLASYHVDQREDVSPCVDARTDPFSTGDLNQHYLLQQNNACFNSTNQPQDFGCGKASDVLPNTNSAQLSRDLETSGHSFTQEQSTGPRPDADCGPVNPLTATSVYAATLNAEAANSATVSSARVGGHRRRHHTVQTSEEARNDLLRRATANNLYKRLPFNNNLISPVASKDDILGGDGELPRVLSPKGSIFIDPMIKVEGTNGFNTTSTPSHMKFAFNMNKVSHKSVTSILDEVRSTLDNRASSLLYKQSNLLFTLQDGDVQMQIEVCQSPQLSVNGLRLRRLGGDTWNYRRLCNELLSGMNL